jgi:tetratricopeptide (TPR) repeat protein
VNNALTQLQAVVTSSPDNAVAHFQLGRAYLASGRPDGREAARQQFERAIQLRQDLMQPRLGLAELQVMHGEYEAALDSVQEDPAEGSGERQRQGDSIAGLPGTEEVRGLGYPAGRGMLKSNPSSPDVYYQVGLGARRGQAKGRRNGLSSAPMS